MYTPEDSNLAGPLATESTKSNCMERINVKTSDGNLNSMN